MSLPFSKFIPISSSVQKPSFTAQKKHLLFASLSPLIPASSPFLEFDSIFSVAKYFGKNSPEVKVAQTYFNFNSKSGTFPDKLLFARFYKTSAPSFIKGSSVSSLSKIQEKDNFQFVLTINDKSQTFKLSLSSVSSYNEISDAINAQFAKINLPSFKEANCSFIQSLNCFFITSGTLGSDSSINIKGENLDLLGLENPTISKGADQESYASFVSRIFSANSGAFSITTDEDLSNQETEDAIKYLQGSLYGQSINTQIRLVFNFKDKNRAISLQKSFIEKQYTGYVFCYDPYEEGVNILSCAICASIDFTAANSAINFNFQKAKGFTPITNLGDVSSFEKGQTNISLTRELDEAKINYVYSVGVGSSAQVLYGLGLVAGDFGTEDVQVNESALQSALATKIMNGFISMPKLSLQGSEASGFVSSLIMPVFEEFKLNGSIATSGNLSDTDKNTVISLLGDSAAASAISQNGYYFKVQSLSEEDIKARRVRITVCYIASGVINQIRISNNIFGA